MILVTGGAGFIGSNFVLDWLQQSDEPVLNFDRLTYAGNINNLAALAGDRRHLFVQGDIGDSATVLALLQQHQPRAVVHFAAESHVDRSLHDPGAFIATNVNGTFSLLEAVRSYWTTLDTGARSTFRFVQISTDEVFGSLAPDDPPFSETTAYAPNSPYSASKAAADHLVRAYQHSYALPTLTIHCSNNYGPFQFPEKLIPLMISNALAGKSLPLYGDGLQVRDWLYVGDHCAAIRRVLQSGVPGAVYNAGGGNQMTNLAVVQTLCTRLDEMAPKSASYRDQIRYVPDRPGHDRRYAIDARKLARELGWKPTQTFESGIRKTVEWYLSQKAWVANVQSGSHTAWIDKNYGNRERQT